MIKYVMVRYKDFKKRFYRRKKSNLKMCSRIRNLRKTEERIEVVEKLIHQSMDRGPWAMDYGLIKGIKKVEKRPEFNPEVTRVKLNPEQAVLQCNCMSVGRRAGYDDTIWGAQVFSGWQQKPLIIRGYFISGSSVI